MRKTILHRNDRIMRAFKEIGEIRNMTPIQPYGSGDAASKIVEIISEME